MRLSEDKIKAGILHPDCDVRDAAAMYFSRSACRDPFIFPLAIETIDKYGWEQAFIVPPVVEGLPLSEETLPWVVRQLDSEDVRKDRTAFGRGWGGALAWLLCDADANLLARHKSEIDGIKGLRKDDRTLIGTRIDLLTVKADTCWQELQLLCLNSHEDRADPDREYGYALVEAIARQGQQNDADRALSFLAEKIEDLDDYGEAWMELFMVNLAGEMRLDAAVPHIIAKLRGAEERADLLFEEAERALVQIGTDAAVEGAATLFSQGDWIRRMNGCHVFRHVHSDLAVAKTLELLPQEEDATIKACLAQALTSQFAYEGIEPVRQVIHGGNYDESFTDLRLDLIVAATLMEVELREREQWRGEVEKDRAEREKKIRFHAEPSEEEDEDELLPPTKKKIGRNDPCPCGYRKKFKKCCIKKYGNYLLD